MNCNKYQSISKICACQESQLIKNKFLSQLFWTKESSFAKYWIRTYAKNGRTGSIKEVRTSFIHSITSNILYAFTCLRIFTISIFQAIDTFNWISSDTSYGSIRSVWENVSNTINLTGKWKDSRFRIELKVVGVSYIFRS